jgi:hypothetical protein
MGLLSKEEEKEKMTRVHNEMGAVALQNLLQALMLMNEMKPVGTMVVTNKGSKSSNLFLKGPGHSFIPVFSVHNFLFSLFLIYFAY